MTLEESNTSANQILGLSIATLVSRLLGLIKGVVIVRVIGVSIAGDSYILSNFIPNIAYLLLSGGTIASVFMPQIIRLMTKRDSNIGKYYFDLLLVNFIVLTTISALSFFLIPTFIKLYSNEYQGSNFELVVTLARIGIWQLVFMGLFSVLSQIINSYGKFQLIGWASALNNLVVIIVFINYFGIQENNLLKFPFTEMRILEFGTLMGTILQFAISGILIKKNRIPLKMGLIKIDQELIKAFKNILKISSFVIISQVTYVLSVHFLANAQIRAVEKNELAAVGLSIYGNSQLLALAPYWLITIPTLTVLMPKIIDQALKSSKAELERRFIKISSSVNFAILPVICFLIIGANNISYLLFPNLNAYGHFVMAQEIRIFALAVIPMNLNIIALRFMNSFDNIQIQILSTFFLNMSFVIVTLPVVLNSSPEFVIYVLSSGFTVSNLAGAIYSIRQLDKLKINVKFYDVIRLPALLFGLLMMSIFPIYLFVNSYFVSNLATLTILFICGAAIYTSLVRRFAPSEFAVLTYQVRNTFTKHRKFIS